MKVKYRIMLVLCFVIFAMIIIALPKAFAQLQPVRSVEIFSEKTDYNKKEPGAWKVTKSAKWVEKGVAEITIDVDSIMKANKDSDILLVLDTSGLMAGEKFSKAKNASIELIEKIIFNDKNKIGLITFDKESKILSNFTNNKEDLINGLNNLSTKGTTNYYKALICVDSILKKYTVKEDRECRVLFLTGGSSQIETPNEVGEYQYLKAQYPFAKIIGIQYEMGNTIINAIKNVSDLQYIAKMDNLSNLLLDVSGTSIIYDNFEIMHYIDEDYFKVESSKDIKVDSGKFIFDSDTQKITWSINNYKSGSKSKMTIKAKLNEERIDENANFPTSKSEEIKSNIEDSLEEVISTKTPVLAGKFKVTYDLNVPEGCEASGVVPEEKSYYTLEKVALNNKCNDYQFKSWEILTDGVTKINDDYFVVPENNVLIRAVWSKLSLSKSMDGEVK